MVRRGDEMNGAASPIRHDLAAAVDRLQPVERVERPDVIPRGRRRAAERATRQRDEDETSACCDHNVAFLRAAFCNRPAAKNRTPHRIVNCGRGRGNGAEEVTEF